MSADKSMLEETTIATTFARHWELYSECLETTFKRIMRQPLKCDACGRFISEADLQEGYAVRRLKYPDSHFTREEYETLCAKHK